MLALLEGPLRANATRDYYLLACAYYLALRLGEVVVLRAALFDLPEGGGGSVLVPTNKRKARRQDRVDSLTGRPLLPVPVLWGERVLRGAAGWGAGRRWLFPGTKEGLPVTRTTAGVVFRRWASAAGIGGETSFHALRHSAGSHVYEATEDLVVVRDFLRHVSVNTTNIYLHATPTSVERVREALRRRQ